MKRQEYNLNRRIN